MRTITSDGLYAKTMERECSCCKAKFSYESTDIKWVASGCGAVECPQCSAMMVCLLEDEFYKSKEIKKSDNIL